MKKRFLLFSALLSLLLLTGCTKQLTDKPLTLSFPEETAAFTGTLSKGTYTGTVLGDGWQFEGTLTAECLLTGEGEMFPPRRALWERGGRNVHRLARLRHAGRRGHVHARLGRFVHRRIFRRTAVRGEAADLPWTRCTAAAAFSGSTPAA